MTELEGRIPVTVVVEDGEVVEVIAHDTEFEYIGQEEWDEDQRAAHAIAENAMWPAWEWGS